MTSITTPIHWSEAIANYLQKQVLDTTDALSQPITDLFLQLGTALDDGHTVIELTNEQVGYFMSQPSALVHIISDEDITKIKTHKPIVIHNNLAYLHRQWQQEYALAGHITRLLHQNSMVSSIDEQQLPASMHEHQLSAIQTASTHHFTIITGGPGTGKTWTIAQLVIALFKQSPNMSIALAAPTGKAAQRMQEALDKGIESSIDASKNAQLLNDIKNKLEPAKTIHRLLGMGFSQTARFNQQKPLPYDLIIIDEASMLGVALANQLFGAIANSSKLIFLGDANQLAAVDAGAVLADLCHTEQLHNHHVHLSKSNRFSDDSAVGMLAKSVLENQPKQAIQTIHECSDINWVNPFAQSQLIDDTYKQLWQPFVDYASCIKNMMHQPQTKQAESIKSLFEKFDTYRILTATHGGFLGDIKINLALSKQLQSHCQLINHTHDWYHGRPIMMLKNDYQLKVSNGDIGIALQDDVGNFLVYFPHLSMPIAISRFHKNHISTAFAMTIHKSQGSEYQKVAIVLDQLKDSTENSARNLLSKELVYTAITRAKKYIDLYCNEATLTHCIRTQTIRHTGLSHLL